MHRRLPTLILLLIWGSLAAAQSGHFLGRTLSHLDQRGVSFSFQLYTDALAGSQSSTATNSTSAQYADISTAIELGQLSSRLLHTRVFTSVHINGSYAADFDEAQQSMIGITSSPGVRLAEFWVEHSFVPSARIRVGQIDANPDFAFVETATGFLNAAFSYDPTFFTIPNYNATNWGGEVLLQRGTVHANLAVFSPSDGTGPLLMQEIGADWRSGDWKGRFSLGAWQRTGSMPSFSGMNEEGSHGAYFVGEQRFWRRQRHNGTQEQSLSAFAQIGAAPPAFSTFTRHLGAGLVWSAPFASRDHDSAGFAITRGRFTSHPNAEFDQSHETVFEAYYRFQLGAHFSVSPDFQYVIHPGGASRNQNAFAVGARMVFSMASKSE